MLISNTRPLAKYYNEQLHTSSSDGELRVGVQALSRETRDGPSNLKIGPPKIGHSKYVGMGMNSEQHYI